MRTEIRYPGPSERQQILDCVPANTCRMVLDTSIKPGTCLVILSATERRTVKLGADAHSGEWHQLSGSAGACTAGNHVANSAKGIK